MVKCVVSGCPNRQQNVNRGIFNRPPKRFFNFPKDPARVKVWLAALRETDKQDSTEQHWICEDHFLPEDISTDGVNSDAIPIMPPCLDGPLGVISPWGPEEEEEEDQWAIAGSDDEEEAVGAAEEIDVPACAEPPAPGSPSPEPPQQDPGGVLHDSPGEKSKTGSVHPRTQGQTGAPIRDSSLGQLTQRFLELMLSCPDTWLEVGQVASRLQTHTKRVVDITSVLEAVSLIQKTSNKVKWVGSCPISSFLWRNHHIKREVENMKLVESTLDVLIKSCAQQLFDMTDDTRNSSSAYITHEDISRLAAFQEQTVIVVKAPEETKLEVPAPTEDSIKIHLRAGKAPIMVMTCDVGTGSEQGSCFSSLEDSRIKTSGL